MTEEEILKIFLPEEIDWNRYELIKIEQIKDETISPFVGRLYFYIEEKNTIPKEEKYYGKQIISKGFYPNKKIHDFPVRDKIATLIVKRRKWQEKAGGEIINKELEINYPGTQSTKTLLAFLK